MAKIITKAATRYSYSTAVCHGRWENFLWFSIEMSLKPCVVYKFQCGGCKSIYYGKSIRHLHSRVSQLTGKVSKSPAPGAVFDHFLSCPVNVRVVDDLPVFPTTVRPKMCDFSVLCTASSDFQLKIKESFLISRDRPPLNRNISSLPLLLF